MRLLEIQEFNSYYIKDKSHNRPFFKGEVKPTKHSLWLGEAGGLGLEAAEVGGSPGAPAAAPPPPRCPRSPSMPASQTLTHCRYQQN